VVNQPSFVLLDFDGTLVNSEALIRSAEVSLLQHFLPSAQIDELLSTSTHLSLTDFCQRLTEVSGITRAWESDLRRSYDEIMSRELIPHDGVTEFVTALQGRRCIVTNSSRDDLIQKLSWAGLPPEWAVPSITRDDVRHTKPSPEPYTAALHLVGAAPGDVVAIEDSTPGIRAAQAAGVTVVGFSGGLENENELSATGVRVFADWRALFAEFLA